MSQNGKKREFSELPADMESQGSTSKAPKIQDEEDDEVVFVCEEGPPSLEKPRGKKLSLISWNVNKARNIFNTHACLQENWPANYDVILLLDTQGQQTASNAHFDAFYKTYLPATYIEGQSMCLLTKEKPQRIFFEPGNESEFSTNRVIIAEFSEYLVFGVNAPNVLDNCEQLLEEMKDLRQEYDEVLMEAILMSKQKNSAKPIIILGDFHVAHNLDLDMDDSYVDKTKEVPGFTTREIASFKHILQTGFADTFREKNGDRKVMTANVGEVRPPFINSRSSYILVSKSIMPTVTNADVLTDDNMMFQPIVAELSI